MCVRGREVGWEKRGLRANTVKVSVHVCVEWGAGACVCVGGVTAKLTAPAPYLLHVLQAGNMQPPGLKPVVVEINCRARYLGQLNGKPSQQLGSVLKGKTRNSRTTRGQPVGVYV